MMAVPEFIPVASPVSESIVARLVSLLLHVPPGVVSENWSVRPWHTDGLTAVGVAGIGFIVIV
jgi:hypothetical protein